MQFFTIIVALVGAVAALPLGTPDVVARDIAGSETVQQCKRDGSSSGRGFICDPSKL